MSLNATLLWKEWRETRIFLLIALGIFVGLPIIGNLENLAQYSHHFEINTSIFVYPLGGVLAVFVAVGSTCRDLRPKLEDFWRSRPVSPVRWMLIKYGIGLLIVEISCLLPLVIEYFTSRDTQQMPAQMLWFAFYWAMIYSLGFLCGTLLRRTAHATVLAFAGLLLIYLLPTIFPPLGWLSIITSAVKDMDLFGAIHAAAGTLAITVPLLLCSLAAARWQWHIEPGPKFMYGSISAAVLIFLLSAGYHLGTNLPVLQTAELPSDDSANYVHYYQGTIYLMTQGPTTEIHGPKGWKTVSHWYWQKIEVDARGIKLSARTAYEPENVLWPWFRGWYGFDGNVAYLTDYIDYIDPSGRGGAPLFLFTVNYGPDFLIGHQHINSLALPLRSVAKGYDPSPRPYVWKNRLYLIGHTLITLDISDRTKPRVISSAPLGYPEPGDRQETDYMPDADTLVFELPDVSGLPLAQRLDFASERWNGAFDGQVLCRFENGELSEFHLSQLTGTRAIFKLVGTIRSGLIDYIFGYASFSDAHLQNGLLYVSQGGYNGNNFNPRISVYQTRGPGAPRMIAHFASPGTTDDAAPLPDGRAVIAGKKIWLVGPPPQRNQ